MILLALIDLLIIAALSICVVILFGPLRALLVIVETLGWAALRAFRWVSCTMSIHPRTRWEVLKEHSYYDDTLHVKFRGLCPDCDRKVRGPHFIISREDLEDGVPLSMLDTNILNVF